MFFEYTMQFFNGFKVSKRYFKELYVNSSQITHKILHNSIEKPPECIL